VDDDGNLTSIHVDDSDITINFCLGSSFTGSQLRFMNNDKEIFEYQQVSGQDIIHLGNYKHEVLPIMSGTRFCLILWCRKTEKLLVQ